MARTPGTLTEAAPAERQAERQRFLQQRICDLQLRIEGTRLEALVQRLHAELRAAGLQRFQPLVYLSDEWGCPDRLPIIGVPFFLADERLTRLEEERIGIVEAETDAEILRYLRHEAGHAFNYAYQLFETPEWERLFGPFARPYTEDYTPDAFSQDYVRYLPGWYAQMHPDEDFAETFAVWLDPEAQWRQAYQGWGCFRKLEYVAARAREMAEVDPPVSAAQYVTDEVGLSCSLEDYYRRHAGSTVPPPAGLDATLRDIFVPPAGAGGSAPSAVAFLDQHRRSIILAVFHWTGLNYLHLHGLFDSIRGRCAALDLRVPAEGVTALIALTTVITTLSMNRLYRGDFVPRGGGEREPQ